MTLRLILRSMRIERGRLLCGALGVAAATGLLAWHVGLAMTAIHSGHDAARKAASPFSAWIGAPSAAQGAAESGKSRGSGRSEDAKNSEKSERSEKAFKGRERATAEATRGRRMAPRGAGRPIPATLIRALEESAIVKGVCAISTLNVTMDARPGGRVLQGPPFSGNAALLPANGIPFDVGDVEGRLPDQSSEEPEAIVSESLFGARVPKPEVGSVMPFVLAQGTVPVRFTGFFKSSGLVQAFPSIYVNKAAWDAIMRLTPGFRGLPTLVLVETANGIDPADVGRIIDSVPEADSCPLYTVDAVSARFRTDTVSNLLSQTPMSLTIAFIAATCLLATILSIGLELRRRRIAELRCAGMTRGGVVRLVAAEASLLIVTGCAAGIAFAALALKAFLVFEGPGGDMPENVWLGWQAPVVCATFAVAVGCLATLVPAIKATRVRPLDVVDRDVSALRRVSVAKSVAAILLLLPMPIVAMDFAMPEKTKTILMVLIGMPCLVLSLILGMHPFMRLVERCAMRPLALALRIDPRLLERRLSRDPARATGTILALSLGLGGYVAVHIWGGTLMSSFVPSPEWPDVIVSALPGGFDEAQTKALGECEGVADGRALSIECTQYPMTLADGRTPDGLLLVFGADPSEVFGEHPLAPLRLAEGDLAEAAKLLADDRHCIITKMLSNLTGLHMGDSFTVAGRSLEVAGVADLNWHMVTSRSEVRTRFGNCVRGGRTMGMAFTSEAFARSLTGNADRTFFVWLDMSPELRAMNALKASVLLDSRIRAAVCDDGSSAIRVHHRDEVSDGTLSHGNDILGAMARIPFWSLVVTSTGIAVLLVASVRGSRHEFRMMRAVGMTRSQLARVILGEALLVTAAALLLSLLAGTLIGWSFTGLSRWMMMAGLDVKLIIPWMAIVKGVIFALALCVIFAVIPIGRLVRYVDS